MRDDLLQTGARLHRLDQFKIGTDRLNASLLNGFLVHACAVVVADELIGRGRLCLRGLSRSLFENAVQHLFVGLARLPTTAPAHHSGGDWVLLAPGTICVVEEVHAWVD